MAGWDRDISLCEPKKESNDWNRFQILAEKLAACGAVIFALSAPSLIFCVIYL